MIARRKKIAYVSGTRADFGLMKSVLKAIDQHRGLKLQLYVTGMHLMRQFGQTIREVKRIFPKTKILKAMVSGDNHAAAAQFFAKVSMVVSREFTRNRPDLVFVLGDRPEMLAVACVCLYLGIPVAQLHGGERTGTVDELARHAITKLGSLHLPATADAAKRIRKLGEDPRRIKIVGAPAMDTILHARLPVRRQLLKHLGIKQALKSFILVTLHPISEDPEHAGGQMRLVLDAVASFGLPVVAIYPNADVGGKKMIAVLKQYQKQTDFYVFPSIRYENFLALEREAAVWVGNSSGALIEGAYFGTPVVNVGPRQLNRLRGNNVIDADYDLGQIRKAITSALQGKRVKSRSLWGDGRTGPRVAKLLSELPLSKSFQLKRITY